MSTSKKPSKKSSKDTAAKGEASAPAVVTAKSATAKKVAKATTGRKSPLMAAKAMLATALKSTDWQTSLDPKSAKQSLPHLSMGSMIINHLIGGKPNKHGVSPCPGAPKGRILNLYGHEGSGKTTLALTTSATTIRDGGFVCYIDWEHEIVPDYALSLGVPIGNEEKFMLCQPDTLEEGLAILWTMATHGIDLIVLDSVGAGVPKAYFEKAVAETGEQGRVGMNASVWSSFLPKLKSRINKTNSTVIGISQIRDAIKTGPGYGDSITVQGGKAWKFYSAVRMRLQKIHTEKSNDYSAVSNKAKETVTGAKIRAKLDKCKVSSQQGNEEEFYIRWGEGIDDLRSIIEIAIAHRVAVKNGSSFLWVDPDGNEHKKTGIEKFRGMFVDNPQMAKLLERQVLPHMASGGSSSAPGDEDVFDEDFLGGGDDLKEILEGLDLASAADAPPE
jgi:recombination protein RecA